jgi:hypothetical protein
MGNIYRVQAKQLDYDVRLNETASSSNRMVRRESSEVVDSRAPLFDCFMNGIVHRAERSCVLIAVCLPLDLSILSNAVFRAFRGVCISELVPKQACDLEILEPSRTGQKQDK